MKAFALAFALTVLAIAPSANGQDMPDPEGLPEPTEAEPGAAPDPTEATATDPLDPEAEPGSVSVTPVVDEDDKGRSLHHKGQFGGHVTLSKGYRATFPYDKEPCSDDPAKDVCSGSAPMTLDIGATYGLTSTLELLVELRFGLEEEAFIDSRAFGILPGLKINFEPDGALKFFLTTQAIIDSTDHSAAGVKDLDLGLRAALGIQLDFIRNFGLYVQGGANLGVRRWFSFLGEGGAGVEVRFP